MQRKELFKLLQETQPRSRTPIVGWDNSFANKNLSTDYIAELKLKVSPYTQIQDKTMLAKVAYADRYTKKQKNPKQFTARKHYKDQINKTFVTGVNFDFAQYEKEDIMLKKIQNSPLFYHKEGLRYVIGRARTVSQRKRLPEIVSQRKQFNASVLYQNYKNIPNFQSTQQSLRISPTIQTNQAMELLKYIEFFWSKLNVPQQEQLSVNLYVQNQEEKAVNYLTTYLNMLLQCYQSYNKCKKLINSREFIVEILQEKVIEGIRLRKVEQDILPYILQLRNITIKLLQQINSYWQYLQKPQPFMWSEIDYFIKIRQDSKDLLASTALKKLNNLFLHDSIFFIPARIFKSRSNYDRDWKFYYKIAKKLYCPPTVKHTVQNCIEIINIQFDTSISENYFKDLKETNIDTKQILKEVSDYFQSENN